LFINAIKAGWVKRYLDKNNQGQWKIFISKILEKKGGNIVFNSNLAENDIKDMCQNNQFTKDNLTSWNLFRKNYEQNDIQKIIIWNNSDIKINNETLYYKNWHEKGFLYLEHIFDFRLGKFYSFDNMQYLYQITNCLYLKYLQLVLVNSIPKAMQSKLKSVDISQPSEFKSLTELILTTTKISKYLYTKLLRKNVHEPNHIQKWEDQFQDTMFIWNKIYNMPYKASIDTTIQSF